MLKGRQTGSMHRGHSWVFRAESYDTMISWVEDVRTLTEKSPQERNAFVRQHARSISGTSQKAGSISSDGAMDEEDEEPFSANASAVVAAAPSHGQDVSRRPQPGGRFPSDLQINTQRGLQAPLSPSSGSSNFGDGKNSSVAAIPVSAADQYGGEDLRSHAEEVDKRVMKDGVNPYTYQPIQETVSSPRREQQTAPIAAAAGLGGAAMGAVGAEAYNSHAQANQEAAQNDYFPQQLADQAAMEATMIAAPDTDISYKQAEKEATMVAARDTNIENSNQAPLGASNIIAPVMMSAASGNISESSQSQLRDTPTSELPLVESRPPFAEAPRHQSVNSISQLHVPGEYPRSATDLKSPTSPQTPIQKEL